MVFSSLTFLIIFLPPVLLVYYLIPVRARNLWLLISSLCFYWAGAENAIIWLLLVIFACYFSGLILGACRKDIARKITLVISVTTMAILLCYFKYFSFVSKLFNGSNELIENFVMPIGVSFFVFQGISYIVDVYKGCNPIKNPINVGLFVAIFPQLIAGPIIKYPEVSSQMDSKNRITDFTKLSSGLWRFTIGLSKKVLIADRIGGGCLIIFLEQHI